MKMTATNFTNRYVKCQAVDKEKNDFIFHVLIMYVIF
jgi:hypothetical protein